MIPVNVLKALLISAPRNHKIPYLNGVYLDPEGYAVSTDGHRGLAWRAPERWTDALPPGGAIVSYAAVQAAIKAGGLFVVAGNSVRLADGSTPPLIEGKCPQWRRAFPIRANGAVTYEGVKDGGPGHPVVYDPAYLGDLAKQAGLIRGRAAQYVSVTPNGHMAGVAYLSPNCMAVIMPMRVAGPPLTPDETAEHYAAFMR